mmetsp:Transcript_8495/g.18980  ORF Transcript_8495/g.18980 Transcript_8495/m.18980 type:complete len:272 (+) Transcript_8495:84-899(+)
MTACVAPPGDDVAALLTRIVSGDKPTSPLDRAEDTKVSASLVIDCLRGLLAKVDAETGPSWSLPKYFERSLPTLLEAASSQLQEQDALRRKLLVEQDGLWEQVRQKQMQLEALAEVARMRQWQPYKKEVEAEHTLHEAIMQVEELEGIRSSLRKEREGLAKAVDKASASLSSSWQRERAELEADIEKRQLQVEEWQWRIPDLHGQIQALEKDSKELTTEIAAAELMAELLPETENLLKAKQEEHAELMAQVRSARAELAKKGKKKKKPFKP